MKDEKACPSCRSHYFVSISEEREDRYCPFCGVPFQESHPSGEISQHDISFVKGLAPQEEQIQFSIGPYQVLQPIGKGGMGEVFLAYDTSCGRRIALKRVRTDLKEHQILKERFLREARITSQMTHPAIIPIYAIHDEGDSIYYTMPFVEGETLKQILRKTKQQEKEGKTLDHLGGSIPALIRILITLCHAVAYAHSKSILHRDLKPENIIIGTYGEVMILDWGLAKLVGGRPMAHPQQQEKKGAMTRLGKVVGTISYMAPERALGIPATIQTDIYSLGVILYHMLTLQTPFKRGSLKEFQKMQAHETFIYPSEVAPYRDVPKILSEICHKCLSYQPEERYQTVEEFIHDLESYIEGRSEWFPLKQLDTHCKDDWEFQENVVISEHVAISQSTESAEWVSLMISRDSFHSNMQLETTLKFGPEGHGIGFLLGIPEQEERKHINDGYCLWVGSDKSRSTKLLRSTVEVASDPDIQCKRGVEYKIRIDKIDNNICLSINDIPQLTYVGHIPVVGTHMGILARDADYEIGPLSIAVGGQAATVSCLAVPDAFLAHKDYDKALTEYRRIGYAFPGRAEGREALFRAGVTLLEKARYSRSETDYEESLDEFSKLHATPGAPFEYIGKALVYQTLGDLDEEIKCYTLALRRYPRHPLISILHDQLIARMHECSRTQRLATYHFILLSLRHLPQVEAHPPAQKLFHSLEANWETLPFIENRDSPLSFAIAIAFWLGKTFYLEELCHEAASEHHPARFDAIAALIELRAIEQATNILPTIELPAPLSLLIESSSTEQALQSLIDANSWGTPYSVWAFRSLMQMLLLHEQQQTAYTLCKPLFQSPPASLLEPLIWLTLAVNKDATNLIPTLNNDSSPFYFLYGCHLAATQSEKASQKHFSDLLEAPYPRSFCLGAHYLMRKISDTGRWWEQSFLWERRQLFFQLALYAHCANKPQEAKDYRQRALEECIDG